ncbi:hypothetical protein MPSEU_001026000 [Mayamaea pseudoterrestris]|nr:hypothetical protein MPSEU_001026000 [Mayamaea pseudoterrestris]
MATDKGDNHQESSDESSDDDELGLEGVLMRNPDASSSSSSENDDEGDNDDDEQISTEKQGTPVTATATKKKLAETAIDKKNKKKQKRSTDKKEPDVINVTFTFCDMDEKYFHPLKSLLHASSTVYQQYSSELTDHMIDNVSVGTLVSTQDEQADEPNVYGFASVLNVTTYQSSAAIQYLKQQCLEHCPSDRKEELSVVLGGKTKRPAGFLLLGRMINLPLEITLELYQQLVKDLDWAVEHAEGGEEERKSLDFGVFVRLAPCQSEGNSVVYKYFEDEVFSGRAEFCFTMDAPKAYSKEEKQLVNVMAMTKQGFRDAIKDVAKLDKWQ